MSATISVTPVIGASVFSVDVDVHRVDAGCCMILCRMSSLKLRSIFHLGSYTYVRGVRVL